TGGVVGGEILLKRSGERVESVVFANHCPKPVLRPASRSSRSTLKLERPPQGGLLLFRWKQSSCWRQHSAPLAGRPQQPSRPQLRSGCDGEWGTTPVRVD